jgi:hypothetical protein
LKVQDFLKKKSIDTADDLRLQAEMFAYLVATHYNISLQEVYDMDMGVFQQSLSWTLALKEREKKQIARQNMQSRTGSDEVVEFDYSWLDSEDL